MTRRRLMTSVSRNRIKFRDVVCDNYTDSVTTRFSAYKSLFDYEIDREYQKDHTNYDLSLFSIRDSYERLIEANIILYY